MGDTNPKMEAQTSCELEVRGVVEWRRQQLIDAGFPPPLATGIAEDPRYDLHALIELVERGCRPDLADRILAPLEERSAA